MSTHTYDLGDQVVTMSRHRVAGVLVVRELVQRRRFKPSTHWYAEPSQLTSLPRGKRARFMRSVGTKQQFRPLLAELRQALTDAAR